MEKPSSTIVTKKRILWTLGGGLAVVAGLILFFFSDPEPVDADLSQGKSSFEQLLTEQSKALAEKPEFRDFLATKKEPEAAFRAGAELQTEGLRKLNDSLLIERAKIISQLLEHADLNLCASFFNGPEPTLSQGMETALKQLDEKSLKRYFEINLASAESALQHRPNRPFGEETFSEVMEKLGEFFSAEDMEKLLDLLSEAETQKPGAEQSCWGARLLYGSVEKLKAPYNGQLALALISGHQ